jgi:quercetin dioxygenase-like cupin family protein
MAQVDVQMINESGPRNYKNDHGNACMGSHGCIMRATLPALFAMLAFSPISSWSQAKYVPPLQNVQSMSLNANVSATQADSTNETVTPVSRDDTTDAGEPITYPVGASPEVTAAVLTVPPGGKTEWMTHPVPGYVYVLQGTLTVEFEDGHHLTFQSGQGFLQARTKWHRGINQGTEPLRFLAVFFGAKGIPIILHPPESLVETAPR